MAGTQAVHPDRASAAVTRRFTSGLAFIAIGAGIAAPAVLSARAMPARSHGRGPMSSVAPRGNGRYAVVIVVDAARPDYLRLTRMPRLQALMRRGVVYRNAFLGQLPANTPPSHATVGTGVFPKNNGVQGFLWENPRTRQVKNPTMTGAVLNGDLERVIARSGAPTLSGRIKAVYPGSKTVSVSAHKCYAADAMGTPTTDYILCALIYHNRWVAQAVGSHRPPPGAINNPAFDVPILPRTAGLGPAVQQWRQGGENAWTMRYALWAFNRVRYPRLLTINLSETDVLGHFAPRQSVIVQLMAEFDTLLGNLEDAYRRAGILNRTEFVITADHAISPLKRFVRYHNFTDAMQSAGATPVYVEHDTAGYIGIVQHNRSRQVALNMFRLDGKKADATFYKVRIRGRWTYRLAAAQPYITAAARRAYAVLLQTQASNAGADVVVVLAPHTSTRNFAIYGYRWRAGHLGPQWDDQHIPLIIAGPGVRRGVVSTYPARLVDVAPTIERLLGASTKGVDGVVLDDALTSPSKAGTTAQQARGRTLMPIVQALRRRAGH